MSEEINPSPVPESSTPSAKTAERGLYATSQLIAHARGELGHVIAGQAAVIEEVLIAVLCQGHALLEGVPGIAKTLIVKSLGRLLGLGFQRVQATPDLMPADILGTSILRPGTDSFSFHAGPVFTDLLLVDEINRMPPRTQAALLECMEERQVTSDVVRRPLPAWFTVFATQNPVDFEGTYPLPEAQLDRFLLKIEVRRSGVETLEKIVLNRKIGIEPEVPTVLTRDELNQLLDLSQRIYLPPVVANYIARLVDGTHTVGSLGIKYGASPRAALALAAAARSRALLHSRPNAGTEDVRAVAHPILQHRIILDYNARLDGASTATVVEKLLAEIPAQELERPKTLLDAKLR